MALDWDLRSGRLEPILSMAERFRHATHVHTLLRPHAAKHSRCECTPVPRRVTLALYTFALVGLSLHTGVARSLPFHLTTVGVGLGIDFARLLHPGKDF